MNTYTTFRAVLYAVPLFLAPFAEKIADILFADQWPSLPKVVACAMTGIVTMCIGLRAYYDGSYQRNKDATNGAAETPIEPPKP